MVATDRTRIRKDFATAVNMTASELRDWLDTDESRKVGWKGKDGKAAESVGHASGRRIVELLGKNAAELFRPLEEEDHDGMPLHYGYALGAVQFAIHNANGWPGVPTKNAQSPNIAFSTSNLKAVAARLSSHGIKVTGPTDHGFAKAISFRDPDGNFVSVFEYGPEYW